MNAEKMKSSIMVCIFAPAHKTLPQNTSLQQSKC